MERALNAKGASCTTGVPLSIHPSPNTLPTASREKSPMNNFKELKPVQTSVQGSSEDPPGFIYPTYRAAQTETLTDKQSLSSSHPGVAYVSSSVGGSVSTLSFQDTTPRNYWSPPMRRGGGIRVRVRGFSRESRTNL